MNRFFNCGRVFREDAELLKRMATESFDGLHCINASIHAIRIVLSIATTKSGMLPNDVGGPEQFHHVSA